MKKVYAVIETTDQHFDNDLCWDDGYYDDYYETVITCTNYLAFFATEKEANKCSEYLNNEQGQSTWVIEIFIDKVFNKGDFE